MTGHDEVGRLVAVITTDCYNLAEQALFEKLLAGEIGDIRTIYGTYNTGFLWDRINAADTTPSDKL